MMTLSFAFLFEAPEVIILVAGVILAARWLRRAPRAAKLALIGLGLMLAAKMARVGITISSLLGVGASGAAWWGYSYMVFAVGLLAARATPRATVSRSTASPPSPPASRDPRTRVCSGRV